MRCELKDVKRLFFVNGCCPGHDDFPNECYRGRRSIKARSKGKRSEHRYVRRIKKQNLERYLR